MRLARLFVIFFLLPVYLLAQTNGGGKQPRVLLLLDQSSSMLQPWSGNKERYKAARQIILSLMDSVYKVNNQVEFSLRAFGHQSRVQDSNCYDTRNEVMFSKDNYTQMALRLEDLHPSGVTPIAYSLQQAAENDMLDEGNNAYSLVLITDGGESCGGDICAVVKELLAKKINFTPYILSLVDYAPLKMQYQCLGTYMQLTKESDIPATVSTIVAAYKKAFVEIKNEPRQLPVNFSAPSVLKLNIPPIKIGPPAAAPPVKEVPEAPKEQPKPVVKEVPEAPKEQPKPVVKELPPAPKRPAQETIVMLPTSRLQILPIHYKIPVADPIFFSPDKVLPQPKPVVVAPKPPVQETVVMLSVPKIRAYRLRYEIPIPDRMLTPIVKPLPLPIIVADEPEINKVPPAQKPTPPPIVVVPKPVPPPVIAAAAPKPAPVPKPTPKPVIKPIPVQKQPEEKEAKYSVEATDDKETTVNVYFTNGKGKFYSTTPEVLLKDPKTNQIVQKFYRTIDGSNNPDAQHIPAGTYNLTITGRENLVMHNVNIQPNKKNRIDVIVTDGSLHFEYVGDPKTPVTEFFAIVTQRNVSGGANIKQNCSKDLEYEPGNYHIILNTQPPTNINTDIDFGATTVQTIKKPGFITFTNTNKVGRVTLYYQLGDAFLPFMNVDVNGNPDQQKIKLQPGPYEAHFSKVAAMKYASETVVHFAVKSEAVTETELK